MQSSVRFGFVLMVLGSLAIAPACSDDGDTTTGAGGAESGGGEPAAHAGEPAAHAGAGQGGTEGHGASGIVCQVLGELCHAADAGEGKAHDCHELGHKGNVATCEAEFPSCIATCTDAGGGTGGASGTDIDPRCAALGELCHVADTGEGQAHDCHEIGHEGNAAACADAFDACATFCLQAREELESGAGGAGGGVSATSGGAGGAR